MADSSASIFNIPDRSVGQFNSNFNNVEFKIKLPQPPIKPRDNTTARKIRTFSKRMHQDSNPIQHLVSDLINNLEIQSNYNKISFENFAFKEKQSIIGEIANMRPNETYQNLFTRIFKSRDYPSVVPLEKQQAIYLSHALQDSLFELEKEFPNYLDHPNEVQSNFQALQQELSIWLYISSETIKQVSIHSKALALMLDTIQKRFIEYFKLLFVNPTEKVQENTEIKIEDIFKDVEFHDDGTEFGLFRQKLSHFFDFFQKKSPKNPEITLFNQKLDKIKFILDENKRLEKQIDLLKDDIEKLKDEKMNLLNENFELDMLREKSDQAVQEIMKVNQSAREQIIEQQHQICCLRDSSGIMTQPENMGFVPENVQRIWKQISNFCKSILNDELTKITFDNYFPSDINKSSISNSQTDFSLPKQRFNYNSHLHYQSLLTEIKTDFDDQILSKLENKIRIFLNEASDQYQKKFSLFKNEQTAIASKSIKKLNEIRSQQKDGSKWIQIILENKIFLKIPKKIASNTNFRNDPIPTINDIYYTTYTKSLYDMSATKSTLNFFKANGGDPQLLIFLSQIANLSPGIIEIDIFRQFLMDAIPFHCFLFYSEIKFKNKDIGSFDNRTRMKILDDVFNCVGWENITRQQKIAYDSMFCSDTTKFCVFCLALYVFAIDEINNRIKKDNGFSHYQSTNCAELEYLNKFESIEEAIQNFLKPSNEKLFEIIEFMKSLHENDKNDNNNLSFSLKSKNIQQNNKDFTTKELAIVLFKNKVKFDDVIVNFDIENSDLLHYLLDFEVKKKKKGGSNNKAQPAKKKIAVIKKSKNSTTQTKK